MRSLRPRSDKKRYGLRPGTPKPRLSRQGTYFASIAQVTRQGVAVGRQEPEPEVEFRALKQSVPSGMWGGPVPDPVLALAKVLASLVKDDGVTIDLPGVYDAVRPLTSERLWVVCAPVGSLCTWGLSVTCR